MSLYSLVGWITEGDYDTSIGDEMTYASQKSGIVQCPWTIVD